MISSATKPIEAQRIVGIGPKMLMKNPIRITRKIIVGMFILDPFEIVSQNIEIHRKSKI